MTCDTPVATALVGRPSPETSTAHLCLFNLPQFHDLTLKPGQARLQLDHYAEERLIGSLVGVVTGDEFVSGFSAPFGGVDLVRGSEKLPDIADLVVASCARLRDSGIRTIRVRARPAFYSRAEVSVQFALLNEGFRVEAVEFNQHIDLSGLRTAGEYVERLGPRVGQRGLRRSAAQALEFREDFQPEQRAQAYEILRVNREAKGRPIRLSLEYIEKLRAALPGRVRCFSLTAAGETCAAAVVYLIRPGCWLVVYWGDARHQLPQSPMNLLAYKLVELALAEGVTLIDLGISSVEGVLNAGLAQFKETVGAKSELRLEFVWRAGQ